MHPAHRVLAARDQKFAQVRVGAIFGDATHVVEEFVLGISAEVGIGDFLICQIGHQGAQIVDAIIDATECAGREAAIAAGFILRRAFQHEDGDAVLGRCMSGAKCRIAGADYDDVT